MKALSFSLLLAAAITGCIHLDGNLGGGPKRSDSGRDDSGSANTRTPQLPGPAASGGDTTLYYTAVRFPASYDWQRDTAFGQVPFELLLCSKGTTLLTLTYGPDAPFDADPKRHHILGGHLYTERMLAKETVIGRDGKELFRFEGREFLLGLMEDGDDLYTISRPVSGKGFTYRRNGKVLLARVDGYVFGDLSDPSYGPGGALYRNDGHIIFCFRAGYVTTAEHYLVRDGVDIRLDEILPGRNVLDLKLNGNQTFILYPSFWRKLLYEGRIWPQGQTYNVTGRLSDGKGGYYYEAMDVYAKALLPPICYEESAVLYHTPEVTCAVATDDTGSVRWYTPAGERRSDEPCLFFSGACATLAGRRFVIALNPINTQHPPRILNGTRTVETDIYGYVSSVALEITPPN